MRACDDPKLVVETTSLQTEDTRLLIKGKEFTCSKLKKIVRYTSCVINSLHPSSNAHGKKCPQFLYNKKCLHSHSTEDDDVRNKWLEWMLVIINMII